MQSGGEIFLAQKFPLEAYKYAQKAALLSQEINNSLMESGAWRIAAESQLQNNKPAEANQTLQNAWTALEKIDDEVETGRVNAQAYKIMQALGEEGKAQNYYKIALEIFSRLGAKRDLQNLEMENS